MVARHITKYYILAELGYVSASHSQDFWVRSGSTVLLPPRMRLAPSERERLWKGLERFVNCADSLSDYEALGRGWSDFWPVEIWHYPNQETPAGESLGLIPPISAGPQNDLSKAEIEETASTSETRSVAWHPACHKLFLFYRDRLRAVWTGAEDSEGAFVGQEDFVMGISHSFENHLGFAKDAIDNPSELPPTWPFCSMALFDACRAIIQKFRTAASGLPVRVTMLWGQGDFSLVPENDFQRAFYFLFRETWRARVCPRCKMFFVARKPKQTFCGTVCSAGSRLASKRKWWRSVGAKKRARQSGPTSKRISRERKRR
jgi:hypothetical protein